MAYTQFNTSQPNQSQQRGQEIDTTRTNLMALRDSIIIGMAAGWSLSIFDGPGAGTAIAGTTMTESVSGYPTIATVVSTAPAVPAQPTLLYHRTTAINTPGERFLMRMGWNVNGYPDKIRYYYTPNYSTTALDFIGRESITYDGNYNVTLVTWDSTDS
jgi:hypothetical protein